MLRRRGGLRRRAPAQDGDDALASTPDRSCRRFRSLTEWEATKDTLHLWAQIVGKVRMASTAPRNHWWHVPLYVDVRGLTTRRMHAPSGVSFEIDFDFVDHRLVVATNGGAVESFELVDGLSVADFDETAARGCWPARRSTWRSARRRSACR